MPMYDAKPQQALLHTICERTGLADSSQLKDPENLTLLYAKLPELVKEDFPFYEWSDAVCYITDRNLPFRSTEEAARYLSMYIRSKAGIGRGRPRQ